MFGNKKRLVGKLEREGGVVAWATVIEAGTRWTSGTNSENGPYTVGDHKHMTVRLRVEPDGEPAFEMKLRQTFVGMYPISDFQVKVIYDPQDHSTIAILEDQIFAPLIGHEQAERLAAHRKQLRAAIDEGRMTEFLQEDIRAKTGGAMAGGTGARVIVDGVPLEVDAQKTRRPDKS
jgi:hypothetical protein